jgi:hypothetical protein
MSEIELGGTGTIPASKADVGALLVQRNRLLAALRAVMGASCREDLIAMRAVIESGAVPAPDGVDVSVMLDGIDVLIECAE